MCVTREMVQAAQASSLWDYGNQVLYDLCRRAPRHENRAEVVAKIWLIGRSYAAAIERRRHASGQNDDYYLNTVAPAIARSGIDTWLASLANYKSVNTGSLPAILVVHRRITRLFSDISGLEKRSLASKYLHFHKPRLAYIYDGRALLGLSNVRQVVGRATPGTGDADNEYRKFAEKCLRLQQYVLETFGTRMTPRQIDNLLLQLSG